MPSRLHPPGPEPDPSFPGSGGGGASHHEWLDGTGCHRGLAEDQLFGPARILAAADVCEALQAARPYRGALAWDEVLAVMGRLAGSARCPVVFEALAASPVGSAAA